MAGDNRARLMWKKGQRHERLLRRTRGVRKECHQDPTKNRRFPTLMTINVKPVIGKKDLDKVRDRK